MPIRNTGILQRQCYSVFSFLTAVPGMNMCFSSGLCVTIQYSLSCSLIWDKLARKPQRAVGGASKWTWSTEIVLDSPRPIKPHPLFDKAPWPSCAGTRANLEIALHAFRAERVSRRMPHELVFNCIKIELPTYTLTINTRAQLFNLDNDKRQQGSLPLVIV